MKDGGLRYPFLDLGKVNERYAAQLKEACARVIDGGIPAEPLFRSMMGVPVSSTAGVTSAAMRLSGLNRNWRLIAECDIPWE